MASTSVRIPKFVNPSEISEILYTEEQIRERVRSLGAELSQYYQNIDQPLVLVGTLKGATPFFADLARALEIDTVWEFMSFSSYGMSASSSGAVQCILDLKLDISGRDVLVVEDILDTGNTVQYIKKNLLARDPKSVRVVAFTHKFEMTKPGIEVDFVGFRVPNKFLVGYGLDYAQKYRSLPFIAVLAPWVYTKSDSSSSAASESVAKTAGEVPVR